MADFTNETLPPNPVFDGNDAANTVAIVSDDPPVDLSTATFQNWVSGADFIIISGASQTTSLSITGSSENDVIIGGLAADVIDGGAGDDLILYDGNDVSIAGGDDTDTLKLNLFGTTAGTGRLVSYEELVLGDPELDANGLPVTRLREASRQIVQDPEFKRAMAGMNTPIDYREGADFQAFLEADGKRLAQTIRQSFPEALVAPTLMVAATDSRHYTGLCPAVYRFMPLAISADDLRRFHGTDERVSVGALGPAVRFYAQWIRAGAG